MAAFAGAGVLVAASMLIRLSSGVAAILSTVSFTETVAGFELVIFAVRRLQAGVAFAAIWRPAATCACWTSGCRASTAWR